MKICQECSSLSEWQEIEIESSSDPDLYYVVTLPPWDRTESEAVCECPSFEYRGRCRHQHEAMSMVCQWTELDGQSQTPEQKTNHVCPDCGGKTKTIVLGA